MSRIETHAAQRCCEVLRRRQLMEPVRMPESLSILSVAAAAVYALVALACVVGTGTAATKNQPVWHRNAWAALAALFIILLCMRGLGIEEWARGILREGLRSDGAYADRRGLQGIIVSAVLACVGAAGGWWFYRASQRLRGRRNVAVMVALASGAAMIFLVVLRLISLHAVDTILYGPLKLNWVGDIGSCAVVAMAAIYYVKLVRARP